MSSSRWYALRVGLFASIGTFLYGFDTGIATTTIAHQSWIDYMHHPTHALTGAVVAIYIAGEAVGALTQTVIGDRLGRIRFMQLMCTIVTVGAAIQTASINIGMFLVGRALAGIAVGGMLCGVPIYLSEISPPKHRGLIGSVSGLGVSFGTMTSNWVGLACSYASYGPKQWRLPLGLQIPWGVILFIGLATFMPNSPRHLVRQGKIAEAHHAFMKLHDDLTRDQAEEEFNLMRRQIDYEMSREITSLREVFIRFRHRALIAISVQTMTSLTGVNVIQVNSPAPSRDQQIQWLITILFRGLGISDKNVLVLVGAYGAIAFIVNAISAVLLTDRWGRRKMLLTGMAVIVLVEIYTAIMQDQFQATDNSVGKAFAVLGIFLFIIGFYGLLISTSYVYAAEVLPIALRSRVMGLAIASHFIVNVAITEAGPTAFATIKQNYYYVFVACTTFFFVVAYFYFPETTQKSLEEIAAAFGDRVVPADDNKPSDKVTAEQDKGDVMHIEMR
ncbi:hypothetical protein N7519_008696 [Penicillium mononematosum]|uniref:uncharacterized protein n=1 Tax=Penicillium mononematosum TaxID=268346 RepID=UPI002548F699|nr:uncharacterized protein N7519_008696 [Penicillium mononematosum]KAJ6178235.1 hypothetical protein N7519_008696 [Penicillium mononematosum]